MLDRRKTREVAAGKWPGILVALGVDEKFLSTKHCACPFCGGHDRFRFDDKDGSGSFICAQCGAGAGIEFLMKLHGWTFKEAAANVDGVVGNVKASHRMDERTEQDKVSAIKRILRECKTVTNGDPVWTYLNRRTGVDSVPADIRYHPSLYHIQGGQHPAMIAMMRDVAGHGVTLHRTYLTHDGNKANVEPNKKFMAGRKLNGSSVRLSKISDCIGIAEGIETAFAASMKFHVDVWAATNAALMECWMPPPGIKSVWIFADNDSSWTGQAAGYSLAKRLERDGFGVDVSIPPKVDTDWCD